MVNHYNLVARHLGTQVRVLRVYLHGENLRILGAVVRVFGGNLLYDISGMDFCSMMGFPNYAADWPVFAIRPAPELGPQYSEENYYALVHPNDGFIHYYSGTGGIGRDLERALWPTIEVSTYIPGAYTPSTPAPAPEPPPNYLQIGATVYVTTLS